MKIEVSKSSNLKAKSSKLKAGILVSGSLVYDTIFDLRGKIREQIVVENGELGAQNLMFTGREKQVYFGGTGGNIAYGLAKLSLRPYLVSVAGLDFDFYRKHLEKLGVNIRIKNDEAGFCSTFYAMTDDNNEQIGIYQGGCADRLLEKISLADCLSKKEIEEIEIAIFSPGTAKSIVNQIEQFRKINKRALLIFDPGQMLAIDFTKELLVRAFKKSDILILNEAEANTLHNKHEFNLEKIFSLGVRCVIETKGENGSVLYEMKDGKLEQKEVGAPKVKKVVDPTGAGDAYRSGLIYGLIGRKSMIESMKLGSEMGARCVKNRGGQGYK